MPKIKTLKTCTFCSKQVYRIAGHGLCAACYYREKRNGTPGYVRVRKQCSVDGCDNLSIAHTYCDKHLRRWKKHGTTNTERLEKWGMQTSHPLRHSHEYIKRNYRDQMPDSWTDFWAFVADVGDRPSEGHRLVRNDYSKPYSQSNVSWQAFKSDVLVKDKAGYAEYARAYRAANPRLYKDQHLRKKYGKNIEWFDAQMQEQGGACAICRSPETAIDPKTGVARDLAVDHCHATGKVRALLCSCCNTALGGFRDDPDLLREAIAYLEKHSPT